HQLVMRFLPKDLPGPQGERRATSHVLFRVETDPQGGQNAIIHSTAPITPTGEAETREVPLASLTAPKGSLIRFRVAAHTVRRNKSTELPLPFDEVPTWLNRQVGPALGHIEILDIQ